MFLKPVEQKKQPQAEVPSFIAMQRQGKTIEDFDSREKATDPKSSAGKKLFKFLLVMGFLFLCFFAAAKGWAMVSLYQSFKDLENQCSAIEADFKNKNYQEVQSDLDLCQAVIVLTKEKTSAIAEDSLNPFNKSVASLGEILDSAYRLSGLFEELNQTMVDWNVELSANSQNSLIDFLFRDIDSVLTLNTRLQAEFSYFKKTLEQQNFIVKMLNKKLAPKLTSLNDLNEVLQKNIPYLTMAKKLLGYDRGRTYLVLFQNSSELRPTGGFWGSYGILKVSAGEIAEFNTDDIYHLDVNLIGKPGSPEPPFGLAKYLNVKQWFLRDANWSPDFADSANLAQYFYFLESGSQEKLDGVIAITPDLIEDLLVLIGPIKVGDILFDRENFLKTLQYEVELGYKDKEISSWNRKDIIDLIAAQLLNRLEGELSFNNFKEIGEILSNSLAKKDILLYFNEPDLQNIIVDNNWAGKILPSASDYLNVIDANLGSYKTDTFIERKIDYRIEKRPKAGDDYDLIAKLEIRYLHRGNFDWQTTRYRTYTRIYVPLGSQLLGSTGVMENDRNPRPGTVQVYDEYDKTVFGAFISIEPQQGGTMTFEYLLPSWLVEKIKQGEYGLTLQKQPGVGNKSITLNFDLGRPIKDVLAFPGDYKLIAGKFVSENWLWTKDAELKLKF